MREYGQIQCSFWNNPDIQGLSDRAKLLAAYLLTGPHSNGIGCYRLPNGYVCGDFNWDDETVSKLFAELFRIGFSDRCETTFFVLIPNYLRWNPIANPNVAKSRVKEFDTIPKNSSIYGALCSSLMELGNHWPNGFANRLRNGMPNKTLPNPTQPNPKSPYQEGIPPKLVSTTVGGGS